MLAVETLSLAFGGTVAHDLVDLSVTEGVEKRCALAGLISGGERQMVAVGRALMGRPRLLVLDEPSMGLAPKIVGEIFSTLARLNRDEGLAVLLAEQNATVALRHADRAVVLENGRSVLAGRAAELLARDDVEAFYLGLVAMAALTAA